MWQPSFPASPGWLVAAVLPLPLLVACSAGTTDPPPLQEPEHTSVLTAALSSTVTRSQALANAQQWVTAKLLYCQSANGQPDYDTSCSSTCVRESNPAWDPYRSDCSGFVSWAWELPAPGLVTSEFAPFDTTASTTIQCVDMLPGDAANRDPNTGHIVLFVAWVTPGTEAVFMEEPGCSSATPYAHEFQSAVTCTGTRVDIAYEGDTFTAVRYVNIVDDPDAGSAADAGDAGGSGSSSGGASGSGSGSSGGAEADAGGTHGGGSSGSGGGLGGGTGEAPAADGGSYAAAADTGNGDAASCDVAPGPSGRGWGACGSIAFALAGLRGARRARRGQRATRRI